MACFYDDPPFALIHELVRFCPKERSGWENINHAFKDHLFRCAAGVPIKIWLISSLPATARHEIGCNAVPLFGGSVIPVEKAGVPRRAIAAIDASYALLLTIWGNFLMVMNFNPILLVCVTYSLWGLYSCYNILFHSYLEIAMTFSY